MPRTSSTPGTGPSSRLWPNKGRRGPSWPGIYLSERFQKVADGGRAAEAAARAASIAAIARKAPHLGEVRAVVEMRPSSRPRRALNGSYKSTSTPGKKKFPRGKGK